MCSADATRSATERVVFGDVERKMRIFKTRRLQAHTRGRGKGCPKSAALAAGGDRRLEARMSPGQETAGKSFGQELARRLMADLGQPASCSMEVRNSCTVFGSRSAFSG